MSGFRLPSLRAIWRAFRRAATWTAVGLLVLTACGAAYLTRRLRDDRPVTYRANAEHFKYGSTGGERGFGLQFGFGVPYWIWIALPRLFPEYLPDHQPDSGYKAFGMIYEAGRDPRFDLPVGMSMRRVEGIDRVYFNCAVCHTGTVRDAPGAPPQVILGMPANRFQLGAVGQFLGKAAGDWRFRSTRLMPAMDQLERLRDSVARNDSGSRPDGMGPVDRLFFEYLGIALMREELLTLTSRLSFIDMARWGPGRVDTFDPPKALLGFPMEKAAPNELGGHADFPAVWHQKYKEGMQLHWDGNNTSVNERNLSAGFGTGATPTTIDRERVLRMAAFLWDEAAPPPFPARYVDATLAAEGAPIYQQHCWSCHGNRTPPFRSAGDGSLVGTVTPIGAVGTDRARLDSYTPMLAAAQNTLYAGYPEDERRCREHPDDTAHCYPARFSHFRKTWGYANVPLDGLWLRAPYLHNGSVPDLQALLEPSASRPVVFHTGYDVYDYGRVGFVTAGPEAERQGWRLDTRLRGNGNGGHEYGTRLPAAEKRALLEYLKTF
jgi:mono/diheme cytochrome c family protein